MHIPLRTTTLFDLPVVCEKKKVVLEFLNEAVFSKNKTFGQYKDAGSLIIIATPNPEQVVQSQEDKNFKAHLLQADLLLPDGVGLVVASKILNLVRPVTPLPERIAGIDLVAELLARAKKENKQVMVVGGRGYEQYFGDEKDSKSDARDTKSSTQIFWTPGYINIAQPTPEEEKEVDSLLAKTKPDLVFVALGAPYQEKWLIEHREQLEKIGVQVAMAVGGTFDVLSGQLPRAPEWLRRVGGEWIFRLLQQPWRWRRQVRLLTFVKLLIQEALK